jgi:hypothetical protein
MRTPRGQNLAALASNHHGLGFGLGLDAALLSLGVSVLVAGIYASVILTFAKIPYVRVMFSIAFE